MLRLYNHQRCVPRSKPPAGLNPAGGFESPLLESGGLLRDRSHHPLEMTVRRDLLELLIE